ncbi:hypothetical protein [Pseudomonas saxonica]|nr:hypothetical protein [Pseudomonas saxonica]WRQ73535.1 hypothetical protein VQY67_15330 [Pseudomonas saxonica]
MAYKLSDVVLLTQEMIRTSLSGNEGVMLELVAQRMPCAAVRAHRK